MSENVQFHYDKNDRTTGSEYDAQHEELLIKGKARWGEDVNLLMEDVELDLD
jgi:hypothetical protein